MRRRDEWAMRALVGVGVIWGKEVNRRLKGVCNIITKIMKGAEISHDLFY